MVFLPDVPIRAVLIGLLVGKFATGYATATTIKIVRVIIPKITLPNIVECYVVFLSIDTPRRDPKDIIFVNPEDGTPEDFIQQRR